MKIYVASSWRNDRQPEIVQTLRGDGHEVYDFRHPWSDDKRGFHWSDIDPNWKKWTVDEYIKALEHDVAIEGFNRDWNAMQWAEACVLVMPCGRSAHLEGGYFAGAKKPLYIIAEDGAESELMYAMATKVCVTVDEVLVAMRSGRVPVSMMTGRHRNDVYEIIGRMEEE